MTHELIDRMVRQANPVPDPTALESESTSVLELQRRTEMQTDDRIHTESESRGPRRFAVIAIAATVLVLVGVLIWLQRGPDTPPIVDSPVTTTATPDTTSPEIITTFPPADAIPAELEGIWYSDRGTAVGIERLVLRNNSYSFPDTPGAAGQASVEGDLIEFSGAPADCPGMGTYRWAIEGTTLTLTSVEPDDCSQRNGRMTVGPFTRNRSGQP